MEARSVEAEAEPEERRVAAGSALFAVIGAVRNFLRRRHGARKARIDWRQVNDHLLRDIGVDRDTVSDLGAALFDAGRFTRGPWP